MHRYLLLFLLVAFGSASVLVVNGDFEQPLTDGWSETMSGAGVMEITRGIGYDPDPDYEVYLHKGDGTGNVEITQLTYVPTTDLQFSVDAKLYAYGTSAQCWSGSGICLYYLNSTDDVLGWSRICARTVACPWTSSSTTHAIEATDTLWHTYSFNLNDELDYVPGVNRQEIAKVLVSVIAQCVDDWGDTEEAEVSADNIVLNYTGTDPYVACMENNVYDLSGNNNGRIDPGETVDLTAMVKNVGGVDFTNLNSTLECNDPYITVTDNSGNFGAIPVDSSKENTSDPYVVSADINAPQGHSADFRMIFTEAAFVDTFEFSMVIGSYHYMVWNPDPTPNPGMAMDSLLTSLGYTGNYSTTLTTDNLEMYRAIFVCVGIFSNNYVINAGSPEATALVNYLNAGGNMYLEGGDVWYYDPLGSGYNFCPLFGMQAVADGTSDGGPFAGEVGTFTQDMIFQYGGENSYIDHINPIGTGFLIFHDTNNNYNCGVANDAGTYKTVGLSFELGGLIDAGAGNTRQDLLDSIMGFFEITTEVEEITKLDVKAPLMQLSPNPYRTTTTIRYSILDSRYSTQNPLIKIYDASGRLVKSIDLASSIQNQESTISWHGDDNAGRKLSAGVYFVQLQTDTHTESQKAILIE